MRFVSFAGPNGTGFGALDGDEIITGPPGTSLRGALESGDLTRSNNAGPRIALADVELLPVIPQPDKILCVGLNYDAHRRETGRDPTKQPVLFTRFANTLVAHGGALVRPRASDKFDFEGELAVIIGKRGRHIRASDALEHVGGYACFCDGTLRDWQRHTHQFTPGKNFVRTGGFGPALVTPDEVGDPAQLTLVSRLNGEEMQRTTTDLMIFDIPRLLSYISTFTELVPGDVIATGTPSGVGFKREPPVFMKPGDRFEVEISRVGRLVLDVRDEATTST